MHNRKAVTKVLYHAFVILFGFMMVYPVLWMISGSFKGNAEILRGTLSLIPKELKRREVPVTVGDGVQNVVVSPGLRAGDKAVILHLGDCWLLAGTID